VEIALSCGFHQQNDRSATEVYISVSKGKFLLQSPRHPIWMKDYSLLKPAPLQ
jgi:hypothetical protein